MALQEYEKFNQRRIEMETQREALADDAELKRATMLIERKRVKLQKKTGRAKE